MDSHANLVIFLSIYSCSLHFLCTTMWWIFGIIIGLEFQLFFRNKVLDLRSSMLMTSITIFWKKFIILWNQWYCIVFKFTRITYFLILYKINHNAICYLCLFFIPNKVICTSIVSVAIILLLNPASRSMPTAFPKRLKYIAAEWINHYTEVSARVLLREWCSALHEWKASHVRAEQSKRIRFISQSSHTPDALMVCEVKVPFMSANVTSI